MSGEFFAMSHPLFIPILIAIAYEQDIMIIAVKTIYVVKFICRIQR